MSPPLGGAGSRWLCHVVVQTPAFPPTDKQVFTLIQVQVTMSLLRISRQVLPRATAAPITAVRYNSNDASTPVAAADKESAITSTLPKDVLPADTISGAPSVLRHRSVRIFQPTRNTMQSGTGKSSRWRLDFDILQGAGRWENPLMGWASSADYNQGVRMSFRTKEDAIHFAERQGWDYYVQSTAPERIPPKNYAENYVYRPNKLRLARTK